MREIKFRYRWQHDSTGEIKRRVLTLEDIENGEAVIGGNWVLQARDQYAGQKDKNEAELYSDDIVKWESGDNGEVETGVIEWDDEYAGFGISGGHCLDWSHAIEKIGNIHENPELLK